ncbi:MAG: hypothetical protein AAFX06_18865 [Planctomycetota bacterium]
MNRLRQGVSSQFPIVAGIASALLSAVATALLLLMNGAIVMVLLGSTFTFSASWMARDGMLQFMLFFIPLLLVVVEWMIWDVVQAVFVRSGND